MSSGGPPQSTHSTLGAGQQQPSSKLVIASTAGKPSGLSLSNTMASSAAALSSSSGGGVAPPTKPTIAGMTALPMAQGGDRVKAPKGPRRSSGGGTKKNSGGRGGGALGSGNKNASSAAVAAAAAAAAVSAAAAKSALSGSSSHVAPASAPPGAGGTVTTAPGGLKDPSKDESKDNKEHHSRSYPRGVGLDFRKLAGLTLLNYIDHHGVPVRPEAPPSELAVAVARHFEVMEVDKDECIGGFLERLEVGGGVGSVAGKIVSTEYSRTTGYFDGYQMPLSVRKRQRSKLAARPGEQVAAKITRTDENGSWILASVQRFYNDTETYDVQDEDDTSKLIRLPWNHVMRLSTGGEGVFNKGTPCMAIFPETTSFYRATVSKQPVWRIDNASNTSSSSTKQSNNNNNSNSGSSNSMVPLVKEMIVKFEDDADDTTGKTPHRRVPARYVIPLPHIYFYDELDDVDLSLAVPNNATTGNSSVEGVNPGKNNTSNTTTTGLPLKAGESISAK